MREMRNLHLRVQEMCDCYATSDPLEEMAKMAHGSDNVEESAIKWLALAILHGINSDAEKISLKKDETGKISVKAKYKTAELPAPAAEIAGAVMAAMREITHIEEKGELPMAVGIRDSSIELTAKLKSKHGKEKLKLEFPC